MATKQVIRELVTLWGFDIDQQPLKEVNAGINVIKQSLKGLAISTAATAAGVGFLLNEAGEDEQTRIAFETLLGSADLALQKLAELEQFAVRTPFTLKGIKQNTRLLLGMGIEADKLIPTLKFLGDVASGLSVPLERLALNYGQVRNQNKLTGRELRDFAIAGVPLLDELAKNLGKTTAEIQSMVSKGDIGFDEVEKAFISMTSGSGRFADLMIKQSKSFFGLLSNIKDILQLLARDLGNELLPAAKEIALAFMEILDVNRDLIRQNLGVFVKNLAGFMISLFQLSMSLFRAMTGVVKIFGGWNKVLGITFKLISAILALGFVLGIGFITKAVWGVVAAFVGWSINIALVTYELSVLGGVLPTISFLFTTLGNSALVAQAKIAAIPLAIGAIVVALALIAEDIFAFSEGRDSVFGRMVLGVEKGLDSIKERFDSFKTYLKTWVASIAATLLGGEVGTILKMFELFGIAQNAGKLVSVSDQLQASDNVIQSGSASAVRGLGGLPFDKMQGEQKNISVSAINEINLNVTGMDTETAKDLVTLTLGDELDSMLRGAVRDGESAVER